MRGCAWRCLIAAERIERMGDAAGERRRRLGPCGQIKRQPAPRRHRLSFVPSSLTRRGQGSRRLRRDHADGINHLAQLLIGNASISARRGGLSFEIRQFFTERSPARTPFDRLVRRVHCVPSCDHSPSDILTHQRGSARRRKASDNNRTSPLSAAVVRRGATGLLRRARPQRPAACPCLL